MTFPQFYLFLRWRDIWEKICILFCTGVGISWLPLRTRKWEGVSAEIVVESSSVVTGIIGRELRVASTSVVRVCSSENHLIPAAEAAHVHCQCCHTGDSFDGHGQPLHTYNSLATFLCPLDHYPPLQLVIHSLSDCLHQSLWELLRAWTAAQQPLIVNSFPAMPRRSWRLKSMERPFRSCWTTTVVLSSTDVCPANADNLLRSAIKVSTDSSPFNQRATNTW